MSVRRVVTTVRINNVVTPVWSIRTIHDVDQPVGTGTLTLPAPLPPAVDIAARVMIDVGYDAATRRIFDGRVASITTASTPEGRTATLELEGWGQLLFAPHYELLRYQGPLELDRIFRSLCAWRGVPFVVADAVLDEAGNPVQLGANPDVDDGWVPVPPDTSAGELLTRWLHHFGYRHFDIPFGIHRMKRINGLPPGDVAELPLYSEDVALLDVGRDATLDGLANYVEVLGARYQAADTSEVAIRSIPATVTTDPRFGASGISKLTVRDDVFTTLGLAAAARNAYEVALGGAPERWAWETTGDPEREPGESVAVQSANVRHSTAPGAAGAAERELPVALWLMRVEHVIGEGGWTTRMQGWAGAGTALPAGDDIVTTSLLGSEGRHLGTEYLSHYRRPNPEGLEITIPFSVADDYTTLTIRAIGHGTNSFVGNTTSTASKFEIWQTVDGTYKSVASGDMPRRDEYLEQRYPYGETSGGVYTNRYWEALVIPLSGSLQAGPADLKIISGYDSAVGDYDDFEVADVVLEAGGVGTPIIS